MSFAAGAKPCVRLVMEEATVPYDRMFDEAFHSAGVAIARRRLPVRRHGAWNEIVDTAESGGSVEMLLLAWSHKEAERVADLERSDSSAAGLALGYPACCVERGITPLSHGKSWGEQLLATARRAGGPVDFRVNRFAAEWGGLGAIGELYPCSLECEEAIRYSQEMLDAAMGLGLSELTRRAMADAKAPVLLEGGGRVRRADHNEPRRITFR